MVCFHDNLRRDIMDGIHNWPYGWTKELVRYFDKPTTKIIPIIREPEALDRKNNDKEVSFAPFLQIIYFLVVPLLEPGRSYFLSPDLPRDFRNGAFVQLQNSRYYSNDSDQMVRGWYVAGLRELRESDRDELYNFDSSDDRVIAHCFRPQVFIRLEGGWQNW